MNTRRGFIAKTVAAVAAMFGVRQAAAAEDVPDLPRGPFGYVVRHRACPDEPARLQSCFTPTERVCIRDLVDEDRANEVMARLGSQLERIIRARLGQGATDIYVRWRNIFDAETNPDELMGHYYVHALRVTDGSSAQDFKMTLAAMDVEPWVEIDT